MIPDADVVKHLTDALERSQRRWRSPEDHAEAMLDALRQRGWVVIKAPTAD